jgi:hypothetical protein
VGVVQREKSDSELVENRRLIVLGIKRLMGDGNAPAAVTVSRFWSRLKVALLQVECDIRLCIRHEIKYMLVRHDHNSRTKMSLHVLTCTTMLRIV